MDTIVQQGRERGVNLRHSKQTGLCILDKSADIYQSASNKHVLFLSKLSNINTVVIRKTWPGFSDSDIGALDKTLSEIEAGALGELKFVVFDFAHSALPARTESFERQGIAHNETVETCPDRKTASHFSGTCSSAGPSQPYGKGVEKLMERLVDLVVSSPVITVAWARGSMQGADLEFALRCSALLADPATQFSFDCAPEWIASLYGVLTRRLGLVRAERLLEVGETLDAPTMRELCLVKELVDTRDGLAAIETYLLGYARRYNGNLAILRAQRMTERGRAESPKSLQGPRRAAKGSRRPRRTHARKR